MLSDTRDLQFRGINSPIFNLSRPAETCAGFSALWRYVCSYIPGIIDGRCREVFFVFFLIRPEPFSIQFWEERGCDLRSRRRTFSSTRCALNKCGPFTDSYWFAAFCLYGGQDHLRQLSQSCYLEATAQMLFAVIVLFPSCRVAVISRRLRPDISPLIGCFPGLDGDCQ